MFVNGYWVVDTPTKKERRLIEWHSDARLAKACIKDVMVAPGVLCLIFPGCLVWLGWWGTSVSEGWHWAIVPLVWLSSFISMLMLGTLLLARVDQRVKRRSTLISSARVHDAYFEPCGERQHFCRSSALRMLRCATNNQPDLLERHKDQVDRFLTDPEVVRLVELLGRTEPAPTNRQRKLLTNELRWHAIYTARELAERDQPYQELLRQEKLALEQAEHDAAQEARLTLERERDVLDTEIANALRPNEL